jgi:translation initiation factor 1
MSRDPNTRLAYSTGGEQEPEQPPQQPARPGSGKGVRLRLERRASNRVVTLVEGAPGTPAELGELAKALRAACGAGGSVKQGVIELQGDQRAKVEAALRARGLRSKRAGG